MTDHAQLALVFEHRPALSGEDFLIAPGNRDAVAWIDRWPEWPAPALVIHGPAGCGKTHLVQVFLALTGGLGLTADGVAATAPAALLGDAPACALDDADALADGDAEEPLLHLYNTAAETGRRLLLTATAPPARWPVRLPDLRSRLNAAPAAAIGPPDDALIAAVLVKQFADRQLHVDEGVVAYAVARMERSFAAARRLVAAVDAAALARRRNVTVPLVREVLATLEP